jgi:hypothetical protein
MNSDGKIEYSEFREMMLGDSHDNHSEYQQHLKPADHK